MDTLTVRLNTQLRDEVERMLDSPRLSISSAIRVFLAHVVAQKALPFPVQAAPVQAPANDQDSLSVPSHVHVEGMRGKIGNAVHAMRFQFDPCDKGAVMATVRNIGQYAKAGQPAHLLARS